MSYTPGRVAAIRTGYYADPSSPIASTPQKKVAPVSTSKLSSQTPSALSPMRISERPLQRHETPADETKQNWQIFSPVLRFFGAGTDDEKTSGAGAMPTAAPALSPAPPPRKAVTTTAVPSVTTRTTTVSVRHDATVSTATTSSLSGLRGGATAVAAKSTATSVTTVRSVAPAPAPAPAVRTITAPSPAPAPAPAADESDESYEYDYEEFNPYLFIKMLPAYSTVAPRVPRPVLPKKSPRAPEVSLVLDLDETLVHCCVDPIPDADVTFPVAFNGTNYQVYVRKRPHLDKFLQWIAGKFEVTIFTASQQVYAERLLNLLDPDGKYINHRLYRDSCLNVDGNFLKDLNVLGRDLTKTVLVDNSPHAFGYQIDNGIPIESWFDDRTDTELLKLMKFLETIQYAGDVRPALREKFQLQKLVAEASHPRGYM